jgi:glycosyltransferase involved in cell wall biosynthesis
MNIVKIVGKTLTTSSKRRIKKFILKNIYFDRFADTYDSWIIANFPDVLDIELHKDEIKTFTYKPLISITVPTYNTPLNFLHECIRSVLTQSYSNWELVLVDDASPDENVRKVIKEYAELDTRIKYKFLKQNHHIAGATNEAIKLSTGDFVGLFDHDDILWPNALYEVVKALNEDRSIDFIYTDEDKIVEEKSRHSEPFFKPDWSPQLLRTCNYITHFSVFKRTLLDEVGYERGEYNGAQDWEMILRASRKANKVHHIAKIVYSWRVHDNSTAKNMESKPYVTVAQKTALEDDMIIRGYSKDDFKIEQDKNFFAFWRTSLKVGTPKVTIIATSHSQARSIFRKTLYKNCEYIISKTFAEGFSKSTGEYVVFVEPNIKIKTRGWIETLLHSAGGIDAGAVGGLTVYSNKNYIYSAGIAINQDGKLVHALSGGVETGHPKTLTRTLYIKAKRNTSALAGCVMIQKTKLDNYDFQKNVSYTEQLALIGLWLNKVGLNNIYDPMVISVMNAKFVPKKKNSNEEHKRRYTDKEIILTTSTEPYVNVMKKRYFYDDLVSYPDIDHYLEIM